MDTAEIRRRFVAHFERAAHTAVPSASMILADDAGIELLIARLEEDEEMTTFDA